MFSEGFHPLPRVSFHGALPVGVESLAETLDLELAEVLTPAALVDALNRVLPPGIKIVEAVRLPKRLPPPHLEMTVYQVESPEPLFDRDTAEVFLALETFPVTRQRPKKEDRIIDLRELVAQLVVTDPQHLELHLRLREKDNVKVTDALAHIFHLNEDQARDLQILKLRSF